MMVSFKAGKTFRPTVIFAGGLILLAGIAFITQPGGMLMVLAGAFIITSTDRIRIHTDSGKIRAGTCLFGLIGTGKVRNIDEFRGVTVMPFRVCTTTFSLSNQKNSLRETEYRVYLVDRNGHPALLVRRCSTGQEASDEADRISSLLHMPLFSLKNDTDNHANSLELKG